MVPSTTTVEARVASSGHPVLGTGALALPLPVPVAEARTQLQRLAPDITRRHALRASARLVTLLMGDLVALWTVQWLVLLFHRLALASEGVADLGATLLPSGQLGGWRFAAALLLGLLVSGTYAPGDRRRDSARLFAGCALASALVLWEPLWQLGPHVVGVQFLASMLTVWAAVSGERLLIDRAVPGWWTRAARPRTVVVGVGDEAEAAAFSRLGKGPHGYEIIGHVSMRGGRGPRWLGRVDQLPELIDRHRIEAVIVAGVLSDQDFVSIVDVSLTAGCELLSFSRSLALAGVRPALVWHDDQAVVVLTAPALKGHQLLAKRAMDLVVGCLALLALSPAMLATALAIKLTSRGPVLFRQERVGRGGRRFRILKFRTMCQGAEHRLRELKEQSVYADPRLFKVVNDPRVTRVGALLRRTSFDELPQLFNVLRGEMSLVGPRPPIPGEVELYHAHHYCRFDVKPGMTGPWQVNGRNAIRDFEEVVRLEHAYIRDWSLLEDLRILWRTVPAVLRMRGAH